MTTDAEIAFESSWHKTRNQRQSERLSSRAVPDFEIPPPEAGEEVDVETDNSCGSTGEEQSSGWITKLKNPIHSRFKTK